MGSSGFTNWVREIFIRETLEITFDRGPKDAPAIVLIHGIAATSKTWLELKELFDYEDQRIIALDLLGFGKSPSPKHASYSSNEQCRYIRRTLKKAGVKKPFTIVGHSMGSIIAANYAALWPKELTETIYLVSLPLYIKPSKNQPTNIKWQTNIYHSAYGFFLKNREFTIKGAQQIRKLLKLKDGIDVREDNWHSFRLSLKNCIEDQETYLQILESAKKFKIICGKLDEFAVKPALKLVGKQDNVQEIYVPGADHVIGKKMARAIRKEIKTP